MKISIKSIATLIALAAVASLAQPAEKLAADKVAPEAKAEKSAPAKAEKAAPSSTGGALSCDDLKASVSQKIEAKGVKSFSIEIVPNADVKDGKVVGSCGGGTKKLVYKKG